jgi:hypothetical protein
MSHAPNCAEIANRNPQHGIRFFGTASTSQDTAFKSTVTVKCIKTNCPNMVTVTPLGYHEEEVIIKIECKKCYVPPIVSTGTVRIAAEGVLGGLEDAEGFENVEGSRGVEAGEEDVLW